MDGSDLTGSDKARFAAQGVVRTSQGLRLFEGLSVLDNVLVGAQRGERLRLRDAWLRTPAARRRERERLDRAAGALERVGLDRLGDRLVGALSHGQRCRVELARALAARPTYLVLDEPAAGLDPAQVETLANVVTDLRAAGVGLLLVEHDLDLVADLCDSVRTMAQGQLTENALTQAEAGT